jgi:15-cis-phytoene desaturase
MQRYLASMEGAVLSGKLTAQAIARSQEQGVSRQDSSQKESEVKLASTP